MLRPPEAPVLIKVMRLFGPSMSPPSLPLSTVASVDVAHCSAVVAPELLMLPEGFGSIYVGQRFCCYVTAVNHSDIELTNVSLSVELQSEGSRKVPMEERSRGGVSKARSASLKPGDLVETVAERILSSSGRHCLRVAITYVEYSGVPVAPREKEVTKMYKFEVSDPITFNYRAAFLPTISDGGRSALVESVMCNNTSLALTVSGVRFEPQPGYDAVHVGDGVALGGVSEEPLDVLDVRAQQRRCRVLGPGDVIQHVFRVSVAREASSRWPTSATVDIGRVSAQVKLHMTEQSAWSSLPIVVHTPAESRVSVVIRGLPSTMRLDGSADIALDISNNTTSTLALALKYVQKESAGLVLQGTVAQRIGPIMPRSSQTIGVTVVAVAPGWHKLEGVFVVESGTVLWEASQHLASDVLVHSDGASA